LSIGLVKLKYVELSLSASQEVESLPNELEEVESWTLYLYNGTKVHETHGGQFDEKDYTDLKFKTNDVLTVRLENDSLSFLVNGSTMGEAFT
jgi:hypothetical protein